ncbi:hypothetical protein V1264_021228 [Littorina saxatilis]
MGPSYTCLFMGYLEHQVMQAYTAPVPEFYRRFIDDGLGVTCLSLEDLHSFIEFLQNFHPAIKIKITRFPVSRSCVNLLDISLSISDGVLSTSVFYKETTTQAYVHFDSSHPPATKRGIPFSEFLRLRRLCSNDGDFHTRCIEMASFFLGRGYPQSVIDDAFAKASKKTRESALEQSTPPVNDRPTVCITFHPHTVPICRIIRSNWHILAKSAKFADTFKKGPLFAYKRDRNLRDMLVHSSLRPGPSISGTVSCAKPNCKACPFLSAATHVQGPKGSFTVRRSFTCQNTNVIYALRCGACAMLYIGETYRTFETRLGEHLADIAHHRTDRPVAAHFCADGHSAANVQALCLWQGTGDDFERKRRESNLISRLGTLRPDGINIMP